MSSTSATAQTYNDTNFQGRVLLTGNRRTPLLTAMGGMTSGIRLVAAQEYPMGKTQALDAGSQDVSSETATLSAGTAKYYAPSQEYNVCQIMKYDLAVSSLRLAANQQIDATNITVGELADSMDEFEAQTALKMRQLQLDVEYSLLQGTYVARSAVGTSVATGGLLDSTVGISTNTVDAASADFAPKHLNNLMQTMAGNGAPLSMPAIVVPYNMVPVISNAYGNQPQDWNVGGVAIKMVSTDFGDMPVIGTAQMAANTLIVADLDYLNLVFLPHADGSIILTREYIDGSSARKGWIETFVGADFWSESYHGSITSLATPSFT